MLPAGLAAAGALVVGLVCGGLVFGSWARQPETAGSAPPVAATAYPPAPPSAAPRTPGGETNQPATEPVPAALDFIQVAGVRLPTSPVAGPHDTSEGLARGFTRDRAGVALAAAHILLRVHPQAGSDVFGPTLAGQVIGPYTEALAANVRDGYEQLLQQWPATYGQPAGSLHLSVPGYRIDAYTEAAATVLLLIEVPDGDRSLLGATSLQMSWHRGDWALVAPADGTFAADTSGVDGTAGFTLWESP
jgi:hypothetical protein